MTHPRRRLVLILVTTLVVAAIPTIWIGAKWQRAITNVNKMIVTPASLSTATAVPQAVEELPVAMAEVVREFRAHPAGEHALAMYRDERR